MDKFKTFDLKNCSCIFIVEQCLFHQKYLLCGSITKNKDVHLYLPKSLLNLAKGGN